MRLALRLAQAAFDAGEVPVGAVVVLPGGVVVAEASNRVRLEARTRLPTSLHCLQPRYCVIHLRAARCRAPIVAPAGRSHGSCRDGLHTLRLARARLLAAPGGCHALRDAGAVPNVRWRHSAVPAACRGVGSAKHPSGRRWCAPAPWRGAAALGVTRSSAAAAGSWVSLLQAPGEGGRAEGAAGGPERPHAFQPALVVRSGVLAAECGGMMKAFFSQARTRARHEETRASAGGGQDENDGG